MTGNADIIDLLAGIEPGSPLAILRDARAQAREHAQRSFEALLEPTEPGSFPVGDRYAVAYFTAVLHQDEPAAAFYRDLLEDEDPDRVAVITNVAENARGTGPYGDYREPGLAAESVPGPVWTPDAETSTALGDRLAAALAHTHLLVFRPRESSPAALQGLADAGWDADDVVRLSQLVAFLAFQLRTAAGLRILQSTNLEGATR
ncbi:CMD domain protein [Microlunatus parietis]|uniref:CMD domain protein n=1 Tax=Microlunatus parietis TaxID=682979 RepID=A0A7Y9IBU9_9ACTN|nr:CMD domain protein [Microlunatus parietis]NYE73947.1 CMD domain protein [Microlunatus parietis]